MTNFYDGKRVLVLGGAGFLGSHLVPKLERAGATVIIMDDFSRGVNRDMRKGPVSNVFYAFRGDQDITQAHLCQEAMKDIDIVFNLAAHVAGVIYNQSHHHEMYTKNYALQAIPLQAAIDCGDIELFIQVSSACVYSPEYNHPAIEHNGHKGEPVAANIGYSLAKRMGERLAVWAYQEFDLHTVIVRPSNLVGERDYFDDRAHVVPALIRKCYEQNPIQFYGDGAEVREFLYAGDCAEGLMAAAEHGRPGEAYNLGTGGRTETTIKHLFELIRRVTHTDFKRVERVESHDPGDPLRWANCDKAADELGWCAEMDLIEMVERTVGWWNDSTR